MKEITSTSYKVKFFFKILLRSIGFAIVTSVLIGVINIFIKINFILNLIRLAFTIYGIKVIYIDGLESLNSKYTLNQEEYFKLSQSLTKFLIVIAIISFIFSLLGNSLGVIVEFLAGLFVSSMISDINSTDFIQMSTIIIAILNILANVFYSISVVSIIKHNFNNIFNKQKLEFTQNILVVVALFAILSIISLLIPIGSANESTLNDISKDEIQQISDNESSTSNSKKQDSISAEKYKETVSSSSDAFGILDDNSFYHVGFFSQALYKFDNLEYKNGKKVFEQDDDTSFGDNLSNAVFLYDTKDKVYFYHEKENAEDSGLYSLDFKNTELTQLTSNALTYNLANKVVDYFDYITKDQNTYSIQKYNYETEDSSTIFSFDVPENGTYEIELYGNDYITYITDGSTYSTFYKNDQELCNLDAPIDYFIVAKNQLHVFAFDTVYSIDLESAQILNTIETPFETAGYSKKFKYDPDLTNVNKLVYYGTTLYEFDSENYNFIEVPHSPEYMSSIEEVILDFDENYYLTYGIIEDIPTLVEKDTWKIAKEFSLSDNISFKTGKNNTFYLIYEEDNTIEKLTSDIINSN